MEFRLFRNRHMLDHHHFPNANDLNLGRFFVGMPTSFHEIIAYRSTQDGYNARAKELQPPFLFDLDEKRSWWEDSNSLRSIRATQYQSLRVAFYCPEINARPVCASCVVFKYPFCQCENFYQLNHKPHTAYQIDSNKLTIKMYATITQNAMCSAFHFVQIKTKRK